MNHAPESDYGARFAEAWGALQAYLGDLDAGELASLADRDFDGTLELLRRQPALGDSDILERVRGRAPEALAIAIVEERLRVLLDESLGQSATWGARFLTRWKQLGGSLSQFSYAQIQKLKVADQRGVAEIVRPNAMIWGRGLKELVMDSTPEEAAGHVLNDIRMRTMTMAMLFF